jgi:2-oxoisovalerate dehydrogenase E1 component alpha subunit
MDPTTEATGEQVSLLGADGNLLAHPIYKVDLDDEALRRLYEQMVVVRRIDTEATNLQRQGQLGIWAPCVGQEAAQVGSATALRPDDFIFPSYRELGVAWVRGVDPVDIMRLFRGQSLAGWDMHEHSFACYSIPIGTQPLHAVGWALGARWEGEDQVAATFFGDGATSEGDVSEALNFAAVQAAPVVFFCQNNQWAISVPLSRQVAAPIWRRGAAFGMPGVQVDGNDVLAVYAVTSDAVARARDGGGPTLIEAVTYRLGAHTTSDDPSRYRTRGELADWEARCPINRYRRFLERAGLWSAEFGDEVQATAERIATRVRDSVENLPQPALDDLVAHVYAEPPVTLERQFERLRAFEAQFEPEHA